MPTTLLSEPASVARAWHQMGIVYRSAGQYDKAESAYLSARRIVRKGDATAALRGAVGVG